MSMYIRQAAPQEVYEVAINMRDKDYEELSALMWTEGREELAESMAQRCDALANIYAVGSDEDGVVAVISYMPHRPGVWGLGLFATDKFQKVGRFLTKRIIRDIIPALDGAGAHRVEAQSICGYEEVHDWLRFLGLKEECTLHALGKNGEDFKVFSFTRKPGDRGVRWRKAGEVR